MSKILGLLGTVRFVDRCIVSKSASYLMEPAPDASSEL